MPQRPLLAFELDTVAKELLQMRGVPATQQNFQQAKAAIQANPELSYATPTGKQIGDAEEWNGSPADVMPTDLPVPGEDQIAQMLAGLGSEEQVTAPQQTQVSAETPAQTFPVPQQSQVKGKPLPAAQGQENVSEAAFVDKQPIAAPQQASPESDNPIPDPSSLFGTVGTGAAMLGGAAALSGLKNPVSGTIERTPGAMVPSQAKPNSFIDGVVEILRLAGIDLQPQAIEGSLAKGSLPPAQAKLPGPSSTIVDAIPEFNQGDNIAKQLVKAGGNPQSIPKVTESLRALAAQHGIPVSEIMKLVKALPRL